MRPASVVVFVALLGLSVSSAAQPPQPGAPAPGPPGSQGQVTPPRADAPRPGEAPATGTAVLRGWVVAADTGEPVRRALVRAVAPGNSGGTTSTDEDGRFEIRDLPAGRYTLMASKGGYVTLQYGQRRPRQSGTPLELRDGEVMEKLQFALPPGSVITGTVYDDFGDPVTGANVSAVLRPSATGATPRLMPAGGEGATARTDDRGMFRLYGLPPGSYLVSASRLEPGMPLPGRNDAEGSVTTYYPGTINAAEATPVAVQLGAETTGVSFPIVIGRMASVSGRVIDLRGDRVDRAMVMLAPAGPIRTAVTFSRAYPTQPDGSFAISNVPPGEYSLQVRQFAPGGGELTIGLLPLSVGAGDIDGLVVQMTRAGRVTGRVRTESGAAPGLSPADVQVNLTPARSGGISIGTAPGRVNDDWSFEAAGVFLPGRIMAGVRSPEWTMKAVFHNGRDITDEPFDIHPGETMDGVEVVLIDKVTNVEGAVVDERGAPVLDATILVFSGDSAHWEYFSRYTRSTRPDQSGRYVIRGLRPHGDYRVIAVRDVDDDELRDPEFLASVRDAAVRFSLAEGEHRVENLRVRPD